jgi:glycosyltransferase involved in cell wall biosynthesis
MSFVHRIYGTVRPYLKKVGLLSIARRFVSQEKREQIATTMGLAGFTPPLKPLRDGRYHGPVTVNGINYITDMRANIGLGVSARMIYRALNGWSATSALPVDYLEVETPAVSRNLNEESHARQHDSDLDTYQAVSLIHLIPPEMQFAVESCGPILAKTYNIGFWLWEVPKLPETWANAFDILDEIWTPSTYTREILRRMTDLPVIYMPIPVEITSSGQSIADTRARFGLPADRFIFFFVFNPTSSVARKNPYSLIEAYRRAFEDQPVSDKPLLVIKTHHLSATFNAAVEPGLRAAMDKVGGILIDDDLSRLEMNDLLNASDCFVSLHRAEGFGLGIAESMALGKPVIATGYSANTDFMTSANSYPVDYTLRPITLEDHEAQPMLQAVYVPGDGQVWAEPDIDQAAALMRQVFENPEEAKQRGAIAQRDMLDGWSVEAISRRIDSRLKEIEKLPQVHSALHKA